MPSARPRQSSSRKPPSRIYLIDRHERTVKLGTLRKDALVACCRDGADSSASGFEVGARPLPPLLPHQRRGESRPGRFEIMRVIEPTSKVSKSVVLARTMPEGRDELVVDHAFNPLSVEPGTEVHNGLLTIIGVVHVHKLEPVGATAAATATAAAATTIAAATATATATAPATATAHATATATAAAAAATTIIAIVTTPAPTPTPTPRPRHSHNVYRWSWRRR